MIDLMLPDRSPTLLRRLLGTVALAFALSAGLDVSTAHAQGCSFNGTLNTNTEQLAKGEPVQGNPDADLLLTEFFDPNCPHCQRFKPVMDKVMAQYGDHVRYYKQPLPLWPFSRPQVQAMLLAKEKGKYYEMIDAQLTSPNAGQGGMTIDQIVNLAADVGIDSDWMRSRLQSNAKQAAVNRLPYEARQAGVDSTPTLAIGQKVVPSRSPACIGRLIEQELSSGQTTSSAGGR
jgi:protein-disulfide isomerase